VRSRRLSLWPYLALWGLLLAAQAWAIAHFVPDHSGVGFALVGLLQLAKVPVAVMRLEDLGRPPDDALLALVPLANLGLWGQLNRPTPTPEVWERRRGTWLGQLTAVQAFLRGLVGVGRSLPALLPFALGFGGLFAAGELWIVEQLLSVGQRDPQEQQVLTQVLMVAVGLLLAYTVVQVFKRKTASRASWLPIFLLLPAILSLVTVNLGVGAAAPTSGQGPGMAPLVLASGAWGLGWMCIMGAALAVLWVSAAEAQRDGQTLRLGPALSRMARRTADVSAPHGGAALAIQIGLQVVIPGIHYALQFAFVDAVAVCERDVPALQRSTQLTKGIRRRVFKVYALGFMAAIVAGWVACFPVEAARCTPWGSWPPSWPDGWRASRWRRCSIAARWPSARSSRTCSAAYQP